MSSRLSGGVLGGNGIFRGIRQLLVILAIVFILYYSAKQAGLPANRLEPQGDPPDSLRDSKRAGWQAGYKPLIFND